jgi:hypothetical protein
MLVETKAIRRVLRRTAALAAAASSLHGRLSLHDLNQLNSPATAGSSRGTLRGPFHRKNAEFSPDPG